MLTMFAVVLAIGLLVDDAIVVVENVERLMSEEGLHAARGDATLDGRRSPARWSASRTVLSAVFIPMAFLGGSTGVIYRQFSITIVSAMVLSVIVALVLTPALCATLLKPVEKAKSHGPRALFLAGSIACMRALNHRYQGMVARMVTHCGRYLLIYVALASLMGLLFVRLPTSFLPDEDQGWFLIVGAGAGRRDRDPHATVLDKVQNHFLDSESKTVESMFTVRDSAFRGAGQNTGIGFVLLKRLGEAPSGPTRASRRCGPRLRDLQPDQGRPWCSPSCRRPSSSSALRPVSIST